MSHLSLYIYIYICVFVCVCVCVRNYDIKKESYVRAETINYAERSMKREKRTHNQ